MEAIGQSLLNKGQSLGLLLRQISVYVNFDQAIWSKIDRNELKPMKERLDKLAETIKI